MIQDLAIKNIATFDSTGIRFDNLERINFIYGPNGSGKTTISSLLNSEKQECTVSWVANHPLDIYVYNKDFKEKNILASSFDGIFTLGEKNVDTENQILEARTIIQDYIKQKEKYQRDLQKKIDQIDQLISSKTDEIWTISKDKENILLKPAFEGFRGSKKSFFEKNLKEFTNTSPLLTIEELETKAKSIFKANPTHINQISHISVGLLKDIEGDPIWKEKIIGKADVDLSSLIESLDISDWVNTGTTYIQENDPTCPFCQKKTIDEDFLEKIESYFDDTYKSKKAKIESFQSIYSVNLEKLVLQIEKIIEEHQTDKPYSFDLKSFEAILNRLYEKTSFNQKLIEDKTNEPSRIIELKETTSELLLLNKIIDESNKLINSHNNFNKNLTHSKESLKSEIWRLIVHKNETLLKSYINSKTGFDKAKVSLVRKIKELNDKIQEKESEIKNLTKKQTNTKTTVDDINKTLLSFGFDSFSIKPIKNDKYQLQRKDGTTANETLSEGEVSFITFLYFYHLCKGATNESKISNSRIIVIDDPISSLDSGILFIVSSLVKNIIHNIREDKNYPVKQLILLTHNVYFHKEASFVSGKALSRKDVNFWILKKRSGITKAIFYGNENPILSSYELLWRELYDKHISSISLQNSMRRIIETYFKNFGGLGDTEILEYFDNPQEKTTCHSLICWINDGSHCVSDDLYIDGYSSSNEEYHKVFKTIFEKSGHIAHYEMMMRDKGF